MIGYPLGHEAIVRPGPARTSAAATVRYFGPAGVGERIATKRLAELRKPRRERIGERGGGDKTCSSRLGLLP